MIEENQEPLFIQKLNETTYKVCKAQIKLFNMMDASFYAMIETGREIQERALIFKETKCFETNYCGNPKEEEMIEYARDKKFAFILFVDKISTSNRLYTIASFFTENVKV